MCTCPSSPCSGASPDGWQFRQRGESKTVHARLKAACAAAASDIYALPPETDGTKTACTEFDGVASAACCCANVGKHATRISKSTSAGEIGHFTIVILVI